MCSVSTFTSAAVGVFNPLPTSTGATAIPGYGLPVIIPVTAAYSTFHAHVTPPVDNDFMYSAMASALYKEDRLHYNDDCQMFARADSAFRSELRTMTVLPN